VLWQFYTVWAWLGLMMAATLYDAAFSIVTRARGARARAAITAITLAAGFASTLAYPLTAIGLGCRAAGAPRSGCWRRLSLSSSCRSTARRHAAGGRGAGPRPRQRGAAARSPARWAARVLAARAGLRADRAGRGDPSDQPPAADGGAWRAGDLAILAASVIGPAQVAGRVVLTLAGARAAARAVTLGAFFVISGAALALGAAPRSPPWRWSSRWGWAWATVSSRSCARSSSARSWATAATAKAPGPWRACRFSPSRRPRASARRWPTRRVTAPFWRFAPVPACRGSAAQASAPRMNEKGGPYWAAPVRRWKRFRDQAVSASMAFVPLCAISIRRGFSASGTSRTRSICSMPFSWAAPVTRT
jgi:hypothetical protein